MATVISKRRRPISGVLKVKSGGRIRIAPGASGNRIADNWGSFSKIRKIHFILQAAFRVKNNQKNHEMEPLVRFMVENKPERFRTYEDALNEIRILQKNKIYVIRPN